MTDPQHQLERLTRDRLTLVEAFRLWPRTFIAPIILVVLVLLAVFSGSTLWIVFACVYGGLIAALSPLVFERWYATADQRHTQCTKRRKLIAERPLRKLKTPLLAVPHGEDVVIHTWAPGDRYDPVHHNPRRFHAEDQAEAAQEFVAEFKARQDNKPGPSDDAQALARSINA